MKALAFFGGLLISLGFTVATTAVVGPMAEKRPVVALIVYAAGLALLVGALTAYALAVR